MIPVHFLVSKDSYLLLLEKAILDRKEKTGKYPKAIVPVALYGMPYHIDKILAIAEKYGIPVVEDAAEGMGSRFNGQMTVLDAHIAHHKHVQVHIHKQPVYEGAPVYTNGVEEDLFKVGFCLPVGPYVTDDDVRYIVDCIKEAIVEDTRLVFLSGRRMYLRHRNKRVIWLEY